MVDSLKNDLQNIKSRKADLDLSRTILGLYQTLPRERAEEAEVTLRRMYERARRWDDPVDA
jgi:hypothetical protein